MRRGISRFAFAMGTFHVAVLTLGLALVFYAQTDPVETDTLRVPLTNAEAARNSALGFSAFVLLWVASVVGTHYALLGVHDHSLWIAIRQGILGGALAGVIVLAAITIVVVVVSLGAMLTEGRYALGDFGGLVVYVLLIGVSGTVVAVLVGGAVGFLFSLIDWFVLNMAGIGDSWSPRDEAIRTPRDT